MKIVVFGLSVSSSWGNGHATLWRGLSAALGRRGHTVVFFERDLPFYAPHRDLTVLKGGRLRLYYDWDSIVSEAAEEIERADVAMVTSYCPDAVDAAHLILESNADVKAFYDLDTPVTLDALKRGETVAYLPDEGLRGFDVVLSYTGGAALTELQTRLGAGITLPLYGSVDPDVHHPVRPTETYRSDLSYIGTYAADRQAALERLFIQPASQLPERRFLLAGAQYPMTFPWTSNIYFVQHLPPADHPAFYCSSRVTLNVTRQAMADMGWCPSGRLFEAAACGTPILSDVWDGLDAFFTPGTELLTATSTEEAIAALDLSDEELTAIARAARERTLAEHTADQRARGFELAMESAKCGV